MTTNKKVFVFSENTLKEAKKKVDYWFTYMTNEIGFGILQIEFNAKKDTIIIKPTPSIKIGESESKS